MKQQRFDGKIGESVTFPTFTFSVSKDFKTKHIAVLGLGDRKTCTADTVRTVGGHLVKLAERVNAKTVATILHGAEIDGLNVSESSQALIEGVLLSDYRFHAFHGTKRKGETPRAHLSTLMIAETNRRAYARAQEGIARGRILAEATTYARDLVNTPSSHMTPRHLADEAKRLAGNNITVKIMDEKDMERKKMTAALAVARGSQHPPFAVHLVYRPRSTKKKIAIVGKAVTFDSGGLSLKPAEHMETMKCDMGGAATVLGLFRALKFLTPDVEVHGIFLAVENMPSGAAYRPGDVVTAKNGMTIEIRNTDAEGRVTLADALSYAADLKPDAIIDLATLTGACVVALGEEVAAVYATNDKLAERLVEAGKDVGEPLWRMPLVDAYNQHIASQIADLKNTGAHGGGSITAALFLKNFVGSIPWAHLDIAGPAYTERETRSDQPYGASGYGVRLLAKYLMERKY